MRKGDDLTVEASLEVHRYKHTARDLDDHGTARCSPLRRIDTSVQGPVSKCERDGHRGLLTASWTLQCWLFPDSVGIPMTGLDIFLLLRLHTRHGTKSRPMV